MKSLFDERGFLNRSNCLELRLTSPCPVCTVRVNSKWYDTACCFINQHYYMLDAYKNNLSEVKSYLEKCLPTSYLQIAIELAFPQFQSIFKEVAESRG